MSDRGILVLDIGLSAVQACLYALDRRVLAEARRRLVTHSPSPGWHVQGAGDWWRARVESAGRVRGAPGHRAGPLGSWRGRPGAERARAQTAAAGRLLSGIRRGTWAHELAGPAGISPGSFPCSMPSAAGRCGVTPEAADALELVPGTPVIAV